MYDEYSTNVPEAVLNSCLSGYIPDGSNIFAEELKAYAKGHFLREGLYIEIDGVWKEPEDYSDIYFFFPKQSDSLDISLGFNHIALQPEKYGFSQDKVVEISPKEIELNLSKPAKETYNKILLSREMPLNELLESVGRIVNDSIKFDFESVKQDILKASYGDIEYNISKWNELEKKYTPSGIEVMTGVCKHAGKMIRDILQSLNLRDIRYCHVSANGSDNRDMISHDTTLVFDKNTGEWAVINSKSPRKLYNLVPKEKLPELGRPYVSH